MLISTCFQWISLKIWYQAINSTSPSTTFQVCFWYLLLLMPIIFMESIEADADSIPFSMISIENMISGFVPNINSISPSTTLQVKPVWRYQCTSSTPATQKHFNKLEMKFHIKNSQIFIFGNLQIYIYAATWREINSESCLWLKIIFTEMCIKYKTNQ